MRNNNWLLTAALVLLVAVSQSACARKRPPSPEAGDAQSQDDMSARGIAQKILSFNLEGYRDNGEKKWEIKGSSANILANVITLDYITAKAYGDDGSVTLKAKKGIYDKVTKDVYLENNVIGKTSDGARLLTERLSWNQKTESVSTDALVRIEKDNLFSTGKGATGNPQLKQVELKKDVVVEIRDNPPTLITCDGPLTVNYKRNIAILNNNVKIRDQRGQIDSDTMKIMFDPKTRKITRVVAIGNVRILRDGNSTYSERAMYSVKNGIVKLIGKPKIVVFAREDKKDAAARDQRVG